jgi:predicted nucleic-acid-binding Zn-ribbon protein
MKEDSHCPKCNGPVEVGYVLDKSLHVTAACWVPGEPPASFWGKRSSEEGHGPRIRAVRCKECAFLELYADGPVE